MQRSRLLSLTVAATVAATFATGTVQAQAAPQSATLSAAQAAQLSRNVNTPVIVLLKKNQPQTSLMHELSQVHATHVKSISLVSSVAATVSAAEATRLAADPSVAQVVPDRLIKGAPIPTAPKAGKAGAAGQKGSSGSQVCPAPGKTMLEPEALPVTHTASDDPHAKTAQSLGITGAGVKVAWIADGIDINNPDFIRANGQHVFTDYKDFTGDGPNAPTSADEAFIDASAIAAQGRQVYNVQNWSPHALPTACNIRVLGVAPGASLVGLKVFGDTNYSTTSGIVEAIDYAVRVDHVNVINESFGYDPFPDTGTQDIVRLFNDMATAAGTTVSVSSGDAGTNGTVGSPTDDPDVLSVGASTTFRWYAQTDYGAYQQFAKNGWLNDNISSLSSGGTTQSARTVDLVAPGDSSFALCTPNTDIYQSCVDFNGNPTNVERSGGTSQSSPFVAGAAALVIQAYRKAHNGATPTPATVKKLLTSTADDLGVPAYEQGAGRLNTYKAVEAAMSTGRTVTTDQSQLEATGAPGSAAHWKVKVTNSGSVPQTVKLAGRTFGAAKTIDNGSVTLSDTASPHFSDWQAVNNNYGTLTFKVPAGVDRLDSSIAYPGDPNNGLNARVRVILIDPKGRYAAHSLAQGVGNFGDADVRYPTAGTWTAVIFGRTAANHGTVGKVVFRATIANSHATGNVSPSVLHLAAGQSSTVQLSLTTPSQPGDATTSLVLNAGAGGQTSVPVTTRSLVEPTKGGAFNGTLTGGNGRQADLGQGNFYQFDVAKGQRDLDAGAGLTNDPGDGIVAILIDPQHQAVGFGTNRIASAFNPTTGAATVTPLKDASLYRRNPEPGRWTLVVNFAGPVVGDEISQPFHGAVTLNKVDVKALGLPNGATLAAGKPVAAKVTVHNTGAAPENFFVDPRLNTAADVKLAAAQQATGFALPMPGDAASPAWLVPTETDQVDASASATESALFDWGPINGDPDLISTVGTNPESRFGSLPVTAGLWAADPAVSGVTPEGGAPAGKVDFTVTAHTKPFDSSVTSPVSDLWQTSVTPATSGLTVFTVNPGQTRDIPVTITPSGAKGTVVSGTAYVDDLVVADSPSLNAINYSIALPYVGTGDELAGLPYSYKIG
jgi:Subtilase family